MMDINMIVANNVMDLVRKKDMKQVELADAIGVSKQTMSKMMSGARTINIAELKRIAEYFQVSMDDLVKVPEQADSGNVVMTFMEKVDTDAAREALGFIDELADMIIFHANVRENAKVMAATWEI